MYSNIITVHIIIICRVGLLVSVWNFMKCKVMLSIRNVCFIKRRVVSWKDQEMCSFYGH